MAPEPDSPPVHDLRRIAVLICAAAAVTLLLGLPFLVGGSGGGQVAQVGVDSKPGFVPSDTSWTTSWAQGSSKVARSQARFQAGSPAPWTPPQADRDHVAESFGDDLGVRGRRSGGPHRPAPTATTAPPPRPRRRRSRRRIHLRRPPRRRNHHHDHDGDHHHDDDRNG